MSIGRLLILASCGLLLAGCPEKRKARSRGQIVHRAVIKGDKALPAPKRAPEKSGATESAKPPASATPPPPNNFAARLNRATRSRANPSAPQVSEVGRNGRTKAQVEALRAKALGEPPPETGIRRRRSTRPRSAQVNQKDDLDKPINQDEGMQWGPEDPLMNPDRGTSWEVDPDPKR